MNESLARVTNGKSRKMPLYFDAIFEGSYGLLLSTPFEEKLVYHDYENAFHYTLNLFNDLLDSDEESIHSILERDFDNNNEILNKYSNYFNKIKKSNKNVSIEWRSPVSNSEKKIKIEPKKATKIYKLFNKKTVSNKIIKLHGILKGISLVRYIIEFIDENENDILITAKFKESDSKEIIDLIDKSVVAEFEVESKFNEYKNNEENTYKLVSIKKAE
jgi:hypothetical protein